MVMWIFRPPGENAAMCRYLKRWDENIIIIIIIIRPGDTQTDASLHNALNGRRAADSNAA